MERKQTVADLMMMNQTSQTDRPLRDYEIQSGAAVPPAGTSRERLWDAVMILDPGDCEIIEGKIVIRKSVLARDYVSALHKIGSIEVR